MADVLLYNYSQSEGNIFEANVDNKLIQNELVLVSSEFDLLLVNLHKIETDLQIAENNLKSFFNKLRVIKPLLIATKHEINDESKENNMLYLQYKRLAKDIIKIDYQIKQVKDVKIKNQNEIQNYKKQMRVLQIESKWDEEAMLAWHDEYLKRDTDAMLLRKYAYQDDTLTSVLEINRVSLSSKLIKLKSHNQEQSNELVSVQCELDGIAKDFRHICDDRKKLLELWSKLLDHMLNQDNMIRTASQNLKRATEVNIILNKFFTKRKNDLNSQTEGNIILLNNSFKLSKELVNILLQKKNITLLFEQLSSELKVLKGTVMSTSLEFEKTISENNKLKIDITRSEKKRDEVLELCNFMNNNLKKLKNKILTDEDALKRLEYIYETRFKIDHNLQIKLKLLFDEKQRASVQLKEKNDLEKNLEIAVAGSIVSLKVLVKNMLKLDEESKLHLRNFFEQDFKFLSLRRRIERVTGQNISADERFKIEKQYDKLIKENALKQKEKRILKNEVITIKNELNHTREETKKVREKGNKLALELKKDTCISYMMIASVNKLVQAKHDLIIEFNLTQFKLNELKFKLIEHTSCVSSLEVHQTQVEIATKTQILKTNIFNDQAKLQIRIMDNERRKISAELIERMMQIDKGKLKYEHALISLQETSEFNENCTFTYFIKYMEEHHELKVLGSKINHELQKNIKETIALQNTLAMLNKRCTDQRKEIIQKPLKSNDHEAFLHDRLTSQKLEIDKKRKTLEKLLNEYNTNIQILETEKNGIFEQFKNLRTIFEVKEINFKGLCKEISQYLEMKIRADRMIYPIRKSIRVKDKTIHHLLYEKDIEIRVLNEANKESLNRLIKLVTESLPMLLLTNEMLEQMGFEFCISKSLSKVRTEYSSIKSVNSENRDSTIVYSNNEDNSVNMFMVAGSRSDSKAGCSNSSQILT